MCGLVFGTGSSFGCEKLIKRQTRNSLSGFYNISC